MRIAIVGSRDFNDYDFLVKTINQLFPIIEVIISGGARGVDTLAERYAEDNNIQKEIYLANWPTLTPGCRIGVNKSGNRYNKDAGHIRNTIIVEKADAIIAFWDGKSPGTKNTIEKAKAMKKLIHIIKVCK